MGHHAGQDGLHAATDLIRTEALKFRQFVRPGDTLELTLDWQPDKGRLVFELKGPDGICASGRLVLAAHRES